MFLDFTVFAAIVTSAHKTSIVKEKLNHDYRLLKLASYIWPKRHLYSITILLWKIWLYLHSRRFLMILKRHLKIRIERAHLIEVTTSAAYHQPGNRFALGKSRRAGWARAKAIVAPAAAVMHRFPAHGERLGTFAARNKFVKGALIPCATIAKLFPG